MGGNNSKVELYLAEATWLPYILMDGTKVIRRGLFTRHEIKSGQIITTYAGQGKYVSKTAIGSEEAAYYMTLMRGTTPEVRYVIDGIREPTIGLGLGSFANDKRTTGMNNAKRVVINALGARGQNKTLGIYIVATRDIKPETETTISYGKAYFGEENSSDSGVGSDDQEPGEDEHEYQKRKTKRAKNRQDQQDKIRENIWTKGFSDCRCWLCCTGGRR